MSEMVPVRVVLADDWTWEFRLGAHPLAQSAWNWTRLVSLAPESFVMEEQCSSQPLSRFLGPIRKDLGRTGVGAPGLKRVCRKTWESRRTRNGILGSTKSCEIEHTICVTGVFVGEIGADDVHGLPDRNPATFKPSVCLSLPDCRA